MFVKEIESVELQSLLKAPNPPELIDVRTQAEVAAGIISGALFIPLSLLPLRLEEIPRDKQVIFYCRTGARSAQACMYLAQRGYDNVYNLRGGIVTWVQSGLPIGPPAF